MTDVDALSARGHHGAEHPRHSTCGDLERPPVHHARRPSSAPSGKMDGTDWETYEQGYAMDAYIGKDGLGRPSRAARLRAARVTTHHRRRQHP